MNAKEKVMDEFIKQFKHKDCKDILVDDIANSLGMSKRTIYENFNSKDDIIKQTLSHYLSLEQTKILNLVNKEPNPLIKIFRIFHYFIQHYSQKHLFRVFNLKKQYTNIAEEVFSPHKQFLCNTILEAYKQAQKEGYFFKEIKPEILLALIIGRENDSPQETINIMNKEVNTLDLFIIYFFTILRGVSTQKGMVIWEKYYIEFTNKDFSNIDKIIDNNNNK